METGSASDTGSGESLNERDEEIPYEKRKNYDVNRSSTLTLFAIFNILC